MNKEIKQEWVAALRSGEYKQTQGVLRHDDGYCCLGVLCDLYSKANPEKVWEPFPRGDSTHIFMGRNADLPHEVVEWAGLEDSSPVLQEEEGDMALIDLNDGFLEPEREGYIRRHSFVEIADKIEKYL